MSNTTVCQSCRMTLRSETDKGTNLDGSKNNDYCHHCFEEGKFKKEETMEEMIESCIPFEIKAGVYINEEAAQKDMIMQFKKLKRWRD